MAEIIGSGSKDNQVSDDEIMNSADNTGLESLHTVDDYVSVTYDGLFAGDWDNMSDTRAVLDCRSVLSRKRLRMTSVSYKEVIGSPVTRVRDNDTDGVQERTVVPLPPVRLPPVRLYPERFHDLQKFEGTVLTVSSDSFMARLQDKTNQLPEEEAEFPLEEVMPGDRELVEVGAVFYWTIGYERKVYGQQSRSSVIRFRRIPSWSTQEIEDAKDSANTFLSFLDLNSANEPA